MSGGAKPDNIAPLRKPVPCPLCKANSNRDHYPFCSQRCQDVDMHRWFSGSYTLGNEAQDDTCEPDEFGSNPL